MSTEDEFGTVRRPSRYDGQPQRYDPRCMFEHQGERCPFPGGGSDSNSRDAATYCVQHMLATRRGHGIDQDEWFAMHRDPQAVRDRMYLWHRESTADLVAENAKQYERRPDETRSAWMLRLRQEWARINPGLRHIAERLAAGKGVPIDGDRRA